MTALVVISGDSISWGSGAIDGVAWHQYVTNRPTAEWRSYSVPGFTMNAPPVSASAVAAMFSGYSEYIVILYLGTNDVATRTGAQMHTDYDNYCTTIRNAGGKVVACTLPQQPAHDDVAQAFNTLLLASSNHNALANLRAVLPDCTDTTLFSTDGIHPTTAGHALIGSTVNTAMTGMA